MLYLELLALNILETEFIFILSYYSSCPKTLMMLSLLLEEYDYLGWFSFEVILDKFSSYLDYCELFLDLVLTLFKVLQGLNNLVLSSFKVLEEVKPLVRG